MAETAFWIGPTDDPDRYEVSDMRSKGGEGELWFGSVRVGDQSLPVAVKVLRPPQGVSLELLTEQVRGQAELLRSLDHPNLIKVREAFTGPYGHEQGQADLTTQALYLVMNWAPGENLEAWVARHPQRDVLECARQVTRLAAAVDELHSGRATGGAAVLHRDIKPANVVVDDDQLRLVDFGLARFATGQPSTVAGTPPYLAPEILAGAPPSEASDRFALGATAYFIFTGSPPDLTNPAAMRAALMAVPGIADQDGFADHVMAMVERDPARRPTNLTEWAQALAVGAVSQRFPAMATTAGEPAKPKRRRRKALLVLLGVLLVAGAGAAGAVALTGGADDSDGGANDDSAEAASPAETTAPEDTVIELQVPNVVGQNIDDVQAELEGEDFSVQVEYEESAEQPGTILAQDPSPGSTAESLIVLTVAELPSELPDVVGQTISEAQSALEGLGITVTVQDQLNERAVDGEVLRQQPAAGTPFTEDVTLFVARQPEITFLADLSPVDGNSDSATVRISGQTYTRAVVLSYLRDAGDQSEVEYDLSRAFSRFRATLGLTDTSSNEITVRVEIFGDGRRIFSRDLALGNAFPLDIDVTGVLRLTLSATQLGGDGYDDSYLAFGDAALLAPQGTEVPTTEDN